MKLSPIRTAFIILVSILSLFIVLPNFYDDETVASWPDFMPKQKVVLGLDLQGGAHLLLQVNQNDIVTGRLGDIRREARTLLINEGIGSLITTRDKTLDIQITDPAQRDRAREVLKPLNTTVDTGMFSVGGVAETTIENFGSDRIRVTLTDDGIKSRMSSLVGQSVEVIRKRIDEVGTTEPLIMRQGQDRVLVQVPGFGDSARLKELISQTARLTFHMVYPSMSADQARLNGLPPGTMIVPSADGFDELLYEDVAIGGESLVDAQPSFDQNGQSVVSFRFNTQGAVVFGDITAKNIGRRFAIVLDDQVITAPVIQSVISGGSGQISGSFDPQTASDLAVLLRAGALPATLDVVEERTVGPSLGADSIAGGITAGIVGTIAVMLFMFVVYGRFGLFANLALIVNIGMIFAALSTLGATLTLPGIAGIVLTIGVAVDSNVLIFERIREELQAGRSPIQSLDAGFKRAMLTIVDANVTTLIAAIVLFFLGSGPVQGFAVTLALGVVTTMFTAYFVTEVITSIWFNVRRPKSFKVNLVKIAPDEPKIRWMKMHIAGFIFSAVLAVASLGVIFTNGIQFGIDFTGGSAVEVQTKGGAADISALRTSLNELQLGSVQVQEFGSPDDVLIRLPMQEGGDVAQQEAVNKVVAAVGDEYEVRRTEVVGPTVSGELAVTGIIGIIAAMIGISIYVWVRFEWQYGVGTMVALIHDLFLTVGFFALLGLEFNTASIAAVLTVIGYSLNDTVVIYDRIRENMVKFRSLSVSEIIDLSLNQTFSRTILTSVTTFMALGALIIFGGEVIRNFTIPMAWGVFVGTYSSVIISAPVLLYTKLKTRTDAEMVKAVKVERRPDGAAV